ncbi:MAG: 23S rRNA (pseudouridine(1915)-N(3))-methyltransferase RlmH [Anaerolineales bacterium]|nr:23S rRNA (pseudouridine(1915)-N(3))-methyltransferase RlmH [Anaerolineales bacterium]
MPLYPGHLQVIAVGKLQGRHWRQAEADYAQRLAHYTRFELLTVRDAVGKSLPDAVAVQREGEQLLKAASGASRIISLTADGKQLDSPGLARWLEERLGVYGRLAFLVGGPIGFSADVLAASHEQLSLSPLTSPHELVRVVLLEQLYRAFTIRNNEKYHK